MSSILHIVNGDSTANILKRTNLKGDIIVHLIEKGFEARPNEVI